jgi:hypothetical protein
MDRLKKLQAIVSRLEGPGISEAVRHFVHPQESLVDLLNSPTLSHQKRLTCGHYLAEFGDPRLGVGLRADGLPDIVWCKVPAGEITFKGIDETFVVDPFYIGKYPVTWIQYRSFLEAKDGYRDKSCWEGLAERWDVPREQIRKLDNHPAEFVHWYDAMAFCRWLTKRLDYELRLPTEWEWQQAATGGNPANEYPWGADWDSSRANTGESDLKQSTPVGLYPHGSSLVGALDMSGNVWEWCLNEHKNPKRVDLNSKENRSVRGGSWNVDLDLARCAYRHYYYPDSRFNGIIGFRVCCASPIF